jgi:hypothetical protein
VVDIELGKQLPDARAISIRANHTRQRYPSPQRSEHRRHAACSAQAFFAAIGPQEDDRRLLADPLRVAPDVAIEHHIANDEHIRLAKSLDKFN